MATSVPQLNTASLAQVSAVTSAAETTASTSHQNQQHSVSVADNILKTHDSHHSSRASVEAAHPDMSQLKGLHDSASLESVDLSVGTPVAPYAAILARTISEEAPDPRIQVSAYKYFCLS